jgi:hypothetical protein
MLLGKYKGNGMKSKRQKGSSCKVYIYDSNCYSYIEVLENTIEFNNNNNDEPTSSFNISGKA